MINIHTPIIGGEKYILVYYIPVCQGLNDKTGAVVDTSFIKALLEVMFI
jgi:hypothetical protein